MKRAWKSLGLGLLYGWLGLAWGVAYEDFMQDEPEKPVAKPKAEPAKPAPKPKPKPKPRTEERVDTRAVVEPELVAIRGGCYQMGSPESESDRSSDERQHQVCVQDYRIGRYEVTQGEWKSVMGSNPSNFPSCGDRCPVEEVSWNDVQDYLAKLNAKTGKKYRLPTEAEWEYACRSGGKAELYCGGSDVGALAWYDGNSGNKTHPVGRKAPNGLGLHDMSGNVWEWTCSAYVGSYDGSESRCVSKNNASAQRVFRGGSWDYVPRYLRSAGRYWTSPDFRYYFQGFRLAQDN